MKIIEKFKRKFNNLEEKYKRFQEGKDYTISVDKEGNKVYDIYSEELRKEVFVNYREEGMIYPRSRKRLKIDFVSTQNSPIWNTFFSKDNELKSSEKQGFSSPERHVIQRQAQQEQLPSYEWK